VFRSVALMLAALALAACSLGGRFAYVRADGQDIGDPAVSQQFNKDRMVCQSEMHGTAGTGDPHANNGMAAGGDAVQDCMEAKGYMVVMQSEAVAKQQELAAQAAEKARREAEAAAPPPPPPPPPPPHKTKLKPKPKPAAPAAPAAAWPQPAQPPPKSSAN
jgi:outer membrane biosynthesis protein TonB